MDATIDGSSRKENSGARVNYGKTRVSSRW